MEGTDNSLSNRQVEVVRKNLVTVFRFAVKALIDKACFSSIDDGCEEFSNFSAAMEHILQHRLRASKMWYLSDSRSHFWFYVKAACRRYDLQSCIVNIDNIENIKSPTAKGRAFLRCALMEKRLSEYLSEALRQTDVTRRYYLPGAIMLGEEATEMCGVLLGLNSIDFGFCLKGENYDTVECPLAISYSPFMKFKQSQESLHSDLEEMRELSCGSSLASEDGHDTPTSESWPERYNSLHKRYMGVLEQKSFLEELMASQERALQTAAAVHQEHHRLQQEAAMQKQQYEAVILELQAQVARMKTINETLQQQLVAARATRLPMTERGGEREEARGDATRFAAAMAYRQDTDRHSLTSSCDRGSTGKAVDTRSLTSAFSEISVDVAGQVDRAAKRGGGDDTHSMVPMTGSLSDLQLDLDPRTGGSRPSSTSTTTIANPEQATPVVSVSHGTYTTTFVDGGGELGDMAGSGKGVKDSSALAPDVPGTARATSSADEGSVIEEAEMALPLNAGDAYEQLTSEDTNRSFSQVSQGAMASGQEVAVDSEDGGCEVDRRKTGKDWDAAIKGDECRATEALEGNLQDSIMVLSSDSSTEDEQGDNSADLGDQASSVTEVQRATSTADNDAKRKEPRHSNSSEEIQPKEPRHSNSSEEIQPKNDTTADAEREVTSASDQDTSDPEVLSTHLTSSNESGASLEEISEPELLGQDCPSTSNTAMARPEDQELSEPEILGQDERSSDKESSPGPQGKEAAHQQVPHHDASHHEESSGQRDLSVNSSDSEGKDGSAMALQKDIAEGEKEESSKAVSDSGSSDGNRDTWDMLSDNNQDSN